MISHCAAFIPDLFSLQHNHAKAVRRGRSSLQDNIGHTVNFLIQKKKKNQAELCGLRSSTKNTIQVGKMKVTSNCSLSTRQLTCC